MSMLHLSNELLLSIGELLEYCWDINSFAQTSRRFDVLLNHYLHQQNIRSFDGSALLWAARYGDETLTQRILDGMVEDDLRDARIDTIRKATKLAAEHGHDRVIQVLLENNISPIYGDEDQSSYYPQDPLSIAVSCGHESVARILLAHGAGKNIMRRLLFCAAEKGYFSIFKSFVETYNCNPESRDPSGRTALAVAALHGQVEITQYLLKLGAKPNSRDYKCYTPIYHAACGDNIQTIPLLLEYGAHINPKMPDGTTMHPICHAIERNSLTTRNPLRLPDLSWNTWILTIPLPTTMNKVC